MQHEPWSRSSAAIGSFSQGSIACRSAALSSTMPMPAQRSGTGSIEYRGLQRMDSTHVQNRFSGGLARTGSLPTLPNHLRPRTSGPGAPREAQEPGRPGRMLGPLGAQRLSNSGLTQQRRLSGSVEGRPTSSCGGVSRAPDTRPSYAAVLTSPALSGARGGTPSHASMNSHGRYGVPQQQPACAPPPWGARASTPGAATMPAPGTSMRAGALAPRSAAANSGLSAGAGGGGGKPPPVLMNGCVASSAADRTPQPQALGTHAAGASAEAKPAKACAAGRPSSGEEHSAPPNGSAAPSPQRGTAPVVFRVGAAAATIQGSHPGKAANQDRYLVELPTATPQAGKAHGSGMGGIAGAHGSGSGSQLAVAAVFDGHGELGHRVSAFVTDKLRAELLGTAEEACQQNGALSAPLIARKLAGSFERTNRALSASGIDVRHSGTTACTAQLAGSELIVANVGDSRAVIGRYEPGAANALIARDLSIDHKPDSDREHRRITRAGGRVAPMHVPGHGFVGPARVWDRSQRFGLATSRAFGDTTHSVTNGGQVIAEPDVTVHRITEHDRYVVLGTDGVWDQISSQEAVGMAAQYGADTKAASNAIAREAKRRWELSGPIRDDITAVVMHIQPVTPPGGSNGNAARAEDAPTSVGAERLGAHTF